MNKTNYANIADRYDKNKYRNQISLDMDLLEFINSVQRRPVNILDLACGTGLYLNIQIPYFKNEAINWYGLDASPEMVDKMRRNVSGVDLKIGVAEDLAYESDFFDFICTNYAFHHFEDKGKVIKEAHRVLKPGGIFKIYNISIYDMQDWWIYQIFPTANDEDRKRFWKKEMIFQELAQSRFDVVLKMNYKREVVKLAKLMDYVYNRDISILTIY